jgi:regulator of RNase E activity RraA
MTDAATIRAQLAEVGTATLTTQLFKRGLRNQFIQGVRPLNRCGRNLVGPATTLRYIPAREDLDVMEVFEDPNHPQRKAIETVPEGNVLVMDCRGDASAASAGGILLTRLKVRGVAGIVTDGGMRDVVDVEALDWPVYAKGPSAPANLARHHAVDVDVPIGCGGVAVYPGDWLVGDLDGVVVIPQEIVAEVAADALAQHGFEEWVMAEVQAGVSIKGLYPPDEATRKRYEAWQQSSRGR